MDLRGKTALVTGANRGIGAAIVAALENEGVARIYAAMRTPRPVASPAVVPIALDVTDEESIARAASAHRDVDLLVNNAGISLGQSLLAPASPDAAEREMQVNYFGVLRMCRAFAPVLAKNGGGAIVNVLSILARVSAPGIGSYAASKAAAYSLTQAIRGELRPRGTLVVGVLPAFVDTDMVRRVAAPKMAPEDVAAALVAALRDGTEDVYPGEAATIAAGLLADPKAVERALAVTLPARG